MAGKRIELDGGMSVEAANRAVLDALFGGGEPTDTAETARSGPEATDFDGGARRPAPAPSDPVADHHATLLALIRARRMGGGGEW